VVSKNSLAKVAMSLLDAAGVVTGDIWCTGAFSFESPLKDLLDSGEYTLEQLLSEDELLQELRGIHPQLIEFFSTEEAAAGLIQYVVLDQSSSPPVLPQTAAATASADLKEGDSDTQEKSVPQAADADDEVAIHNDSETQQQQQQQKEDQQHQKEQAKEAKVKTEMAYVRFPYMACEVICCEINGIIDTIVDGIVPSTVGSVKEVVSSDGDGQNAEVTLENPPRPKTILDVLFLALYNAKPGEIDDYRAGYFDKVLSVLFRKRPQALSKYVNEGGGRGNISLMKAMFKHLYSHSIMQIVQRLLLPQPPLPPRPEEDPDKDDELYSDTMEGAVDMDGMGAFRCNWSESHEALVLLLDCLTSLPAPSETEVDEERRLNLCQNASEVLITIIQNSPLTSPTLITLTTDPVMGSLITAASCLDTGVDFSPHDSKVTCTMNVLESLILQLGGYGSVGTVMLPEEDEDGEEGGEGFEAQEGEQPPQPEFPRQEIATSATLISHLPIMLSSLCNLLQHPSAEKWESPMQFSKAEPQKILGSSRLRIVRLLESLVLLGDANVDALLCESNCLEICLDLFWKFQWCSMLHQSVANLLVHVFEGANMRSELQSYFMVKCNLLGRLMDSFWENSEEAIQNKDSNESTTEGATTDNEKDGENSGDSETREGTVSESGDATEKSVPDRAPAQSFRLGYMGHVIIICQALVHACTNDGGKGEDQSEMGGSPGGTSAGDTKPGIENGDLGRYVGSHSTDDQESEDEEGGSEVTDALERGRAAESVVTEETPLNPLILAQLVDTHPLRMKWQDFVTTTLASETAIQSTPLGGFQMSPGGGMDPLHSHRPGLADDSEYADDDGAAPPLPPRGLLVGGDVIDMDDNDLDIAASMMAGLSMGRVSAGEGRNQNQGDQDLLAGIAPQDGRRQGAGYMFDDPLGGGRFGKFGGDGDDSDDSSDDESGVTKDSGDSGGVLVDGIPYEHSHSGSDDVPVMDLFAGNFEAFDDGSQLSGQDGTWSNFANFDDAFAGQEGVNAPSSDPGEDQPLTQTRSSPPNGDFDEIFGGPKDHAILLEDSDNPKIKDMGDLSSTEVAVDATMEDQPVVEEGVADNAEE
jgi:hypothetical protein